VPKANFDKIKRNPGKRNANERRGVEPKRKPFFDDKEKREELLFNLRITGDIESAIVGITKQKRTLDDYLKTHKDFKAEIKQAIKDYRYITVGVHNPNLKIKAVQRIEELLDKGSVTNIYNQYVLIDENGNQTPVSGNNMKKVEPTPEWVFNAVLSLNEIAGVVIGKAEELPEIVLNGINGKITETLQLESATIPGNEEQK
jgi:hypothetical protein